MESFTCSPLSVQVQRTFECATYSNGLTSLIFSCKAWTSLRNRPLSINIFIDASLIRASLLFLDPRRRLIHCSYFCKRILAVNKLRTQHGIHVNISSGNDNIYVWYNRRRRPLSSGRILSSDADTTRATGKMFQRRYILVKWGEQKLTRRYAYLAAIPLRQHILATA